MKAVIIAHGDMRNNDTAKKICLDADIIICADGGAEYAFNWGITPDYMIGDFDSLRKDILDFYNDKQVEIARYPREKDYTDTELCVYKAIDVGCKEIGILAGIGDRMDHSLGNIGLLHLIADMGARGCIICDECSIYLCKDKIKLDGKPGDTISIIPFYGEAIGVSTLGLKYPLKNANLKFGKPIGISNEMENTMCEISIRSGEILVIKQGNV